MSEVGFYRSDWERIRAVLAQSFSQSVSFNWVTDRSTGAVRLDECNLVGQYACIFARFFDQAGLRLRAGQGDTVCMAVLIRRRAENYSLNGIAIFNCLGKALEKHHAGAFATHETVRRRIERGASAIG